MFAPIVLFTVRAVGMTIAARSLVWPSFDFRGAGHLAKYGGVMAAGQLFWFAAEPVRRVHRRAHFSRARTRHLHDRLFLTQIFVSKFVPPLNEVAFSAYARIQHDDEAVATAFVRATRIIMVAALPFYLGLAATAEPLVLTMLGDEMDRGGAGRPPARLRDAVHDDAGAVRPRVRRARQARASA